VAKQFTPLGKEKHRLLWLHLKPSFPNTIFRYLQEERQTAIAFEEINTIFWPELDPQKPFHSIAERLITNPLNGDIEKSVNLHIKAIEDYKIDGVIQLVHWGCRWNYGRIKILKEVFQNKGIPFLSLDCDLVSQKNFNESRIKNRIDTFLDILD